jgi:hypothetical protein
LIGHFVLIFALLCGFQVSGENLYLRAGATGAETGLNWKDAWSSVAKIKWGSGGGKVGVGDSLWLAGGSYGNINLGSVAVGSGQVSLLRARTNSSDCFNVTGWATAYDSSVFLEITSFGSNLGKFDIQFQNNWFVRTNGVGHNNGRDWNNAWSLGSLNWKFINPGDVIWIAGGSHSTGIVVGRSGTVGNHIYIKRPTALDAVATTATGWSAAYDSQVIISSGGPLRIGASYIYIDGRVDMGMRFNVSNGAGVPASCDLTGGNSVTLTNLDLTGPNAAGHEDGSSCGTALVNFNGDCSGVMIGYGYVPNPGADNITITHCRVRGHPNEFWFAGARNITIEHCKIYDNGAANSATWHGNLMIVNGSDGIIFRYNDVYNWQVEGLYPWGSVSRNWHVYGNVFHDGIGGKNGSAHRFLELRSYSGSITHGPFYVFNNTVVNCWAAITRGDTNVFWTADSVVRNNLVWNVVGGGIGYLPTLADHNFSDGNAGGGTGSISAGAQPFVNFAGGDYRIVSTVATNLPRNKAEVIVNTEMLLYNLDKDGNTRGVDGIWDIGAFENTDH